jgi:methyl-accepting chemotaxis protein
MRNKIILVNVIIVLIVGLLSWVLVRSSLATAAANSAQVANDAKHAVLGASARFQLDALRAERWLSIRASEPATADAVNRGTSNAQGEAATARCDVVAAAAKGAFESAPSLVAIVDAAGKTVGRNGSQMMRGDNLGSVYPGLKEALASGHSGTDVWANAARSDQFLASYAPFRDAQGNVVGAMVLGTPLNDELSRVSDATTGRALILLEASGAEIKPVAHSSTANPGLDTGVAAAKDSITGVISSGHAGAAEAGDLVIAAAPLEQVGNGKHVAIAGAVPSTVIENASGLANPILGVMALGIVLVICAGWLLGNYISRPINQLEEGLLMILNGQSDKRFELDHPDLGGLAFRIDQLLNQLMGVEEDTTDDEGRVSKAPSAQDFTDAMAVDDKRVVASAAGATEQTMDPAVVARLASEPPGEYYGRIYREYISAKRALGEPTEHITEAAFATRIQGMEKDAAAKYGKPVRYEVRSSGKEVVLLAVPLP